MKSVLFVTAIALGLSTATAYAEGEGNGDPFPFHAPGVVTKTDGMAVLPPGLDDPFPFKTPGQVQTQAMSEQVLPAYGSEAGVQSANSLPPGFDTGTVAYASRRPASPAAATQVARHAAPATAGGHG